MSERIPTPSELADRISARLGIEDNEEAASQEVAPIDEPATTIEDGGNVDNILAARRARHESKHNDDPSLEGIVKFDANYNAHWAKGVSNKGGKYAHQGHLDTIREGAAERAVENARFERANEFLPVLDEVEEKLRQAHENSNGRPVDEIAVIRQALVESKVYGDETALKIGNITDNDEIAQVIQFARDIKAKDESNRVEITDPDAPAEAEVVEITDPDAPAEAERVDITDPDAPAESEVVDITDPDAPAEAEAAEPSEPTPEEAEKLERMKRSMDELNDARAKWAEMTTKRQSRAFNYKKIHGYNAAKERYETMVREHGRVSLHDQIEATEDQTQKNAIAIQYYIDEQNKLREIVRHESDNKFINKFSNWMNRGSRKSRVAKGVLIGAVCAGGGALAGAAGAGVLLAGGAAAAGRFVRGYTGRHLSGMEQVNTEEATHHAEASYRRAATANGEVNQFNVMSDVFTSYFEEDAKKEQGRRKKALAWGLGSVAAGAGVGYALTHIPVVSEAAKNARNWVGDKLGGAKDYVGDHTGNGNGNNLFDSNAQGNDLPNHGNPPSGVGEVPAASPDVLTADQLEQVRDFMNIHRGEGGYETLRDIGVPREVRDEIWADAGHKLENVYFKGTEARWSSPGQMSLHDAQVLADSAAKYGVDIRSLIGK